MSALGKAYRTREKTVGILAVDPTSPFTGGAVLGDRIRMRDLSGDPGIFIRSMATRGSLGGLARATRDAVRVMDAAGFDVILIETVGAGQSEIDIARTAHTTVVVEAPGLGDDVQAIKAGILEIADVLVVNKADRPGADNTVRHLRTMLEIGHPAVKSQLVAHHGQWMDVQPSSNDHQDNLWVPLIVKVTASTGQGIDDLLEAIEAHQGHLSSVDIRARMERQHIQLELYERLREVLLARLLQGVSNDEVQHIVNCVQARELDPHSAVQQLLSAQNGGVSGP